MRDQWGNPQGIRTTGTPQVGPVEPAQFTPGLRRNRTYTSVPMVLLLNDVTLRVRPRFTVKNFAPLSTVPVLIASMARNTLVANTPQALQRKASIRISTQTGKY